MECESENGTGTEASPFKEQEVGVLHVSLGSLKRISFVLKSKKRKIIQTTHSVPEVTRSQAVVLRLLSIPSSQRKGLALWKRNGEGTNISELSVLSTRLVSHQRRRGPVGDRMGWDI